MMHKNPPRPRPTRVKEQLSTIPDTSQQLRLKLVWSQHGCHRNNLKLITILKFDQSNNISTLPEMKRNFRTITALL